MPRLLVRLAHKLTAYHWRYNRRSVGSGLLICSCGWTPRWFRVSQWKKWSRPICWVKGHQWVESSWSMGEIDHTEEEAFASGTSRLCTRCKAKDHDLPAPHSRSADNVRRRPGVGS